MMQYNSHYTALLSGGAVRAPCQRDAQDSSLLSARQTRAPLTPSAPPPAPILQYCGLKVQNLIFEVLIY